MEIGNQIKALRLRKGITQEELAQYIGITAQAVSKWENNASTPDITLLPDLSAYFGVSIDELFALSDKTRMERIQNMLWDVRYIETSEVENERSFLVEKARREPSNSEAYEMLAKLELHLAEGHKDRAAEYALAALERNPGSDNAATSLTAALGGKHVDPRNNLHNSLISHFKAIIAAHPDAAAAYPWLIAQLLDDNRIDEAREYCAGFEKLSTKLFPSYYFTKMYIQIALAERDIETAQQLWMGLDRDYPEDWMLQHDIGDFLMLSGNYAAAKAYYRKAIDMLVPPRYNDPIDSLAKLCEMSDDISGAIEVRKLELEISEKEWGDTTGESVDFIKREIARLEKLL